MAKAILIMDMPESCGRCKFLYEFNGVKKCQLMNVLNGGASRVSQSTFTQKRNEKCPLRELPEKQKADTDLLTMESGIVDGWNACLNEILTKGRQT